MVSRKRSAPICKNCDEKQSLIEEMRSLLAPVVEESLGYKNENEILKKRIHELEKALVERKNELESNNSSSCETDKLLEELDLELDSPRPPMVPAELENGKHVNNVSFSVKSYEPHNLQEVRLHSPVLKSSSYPMPSFMSESPENSWTQPNNEPQKKTPKIKTLSTLNGEKTESSKVEQTHYLNPFSVMTPAYTTPSFLAKPCPPILNRSLENENLEYDKNDERPKQKIAVIDDSADKKIVNEIRSSHLCADLIRKIINMKQIELSSDIHEILADDTGYPRSKRLFLISSLDCIKRFSKKNFHMGTSDGIHESTKELKNIVRVLLQLSQSSLLGYELMDYLTSEVKQILLSLMKSSKFSAVSNKSVKQYSNKVSKEHNFESDGSTSSEHEEKHSDNNGSLNEFEEEASYTLWWPISSEYSRLGWLLCKFLTLLYRATDNIEAGCELFVDISLSSVPFVHIHFLLAVLDTWPEIANASNLNSCSLATDPGWIGKAIVTSASTNLPFKSDKSKKIEDKIMLNRLKILFGTELDKSNDKSCSSIEICIEQLIAKHCKLHVTSKTCMFCEENTEESVKNIKNIEMSFGVLASSLLQGWPSRSFWLKEHGKLFEILQIPSEYCDGIRILACKMLTICAISAIRTDGYTKNVTDAEILLHYIDDVTNVLYEVGVTESNLNVQLVAMECRTLLMTSQSEAACVSNWMKNLERYQISLRLAKLLSNFYQSPQAYVINLTRRKERWLSMIAEAQKHKIRLHRIEAIDGRENAQSIPFTDVADFWSTAVNSRYDKRCEQDAAVKMTDSERACAASHLSIWRRHANGELKAYRPQKRSDMILILEDDAILDSFFVEIVDEILDKLKGVEICYLGYSLPREVREEIQELPHKKYPYIQSKTFSGLFSVTSKPVSYSWQTHAYLLSTSAARKLTSEKNLPIDAPVDIYVSTKILYKSICAHICMPPIVSQSHPWYVLVDIMSNGLVRVDNSSWGTSEK